MSCTKSECLHIGNTANVLSKQQLAAQLVQCNACVMYRSGGIKEAVEPHKRTTRSQIGLQYALKYFLSNE